MSLGIPVLLPMCFPYGTGHAQITTQIFVNFVRVAWKIEFVLRIQLYVNHTFFKDGVLFLALFSQIKEFVCHFFSATCHLAFKQYCFFGSLIVVGRPVANESFISLANVNCAFLFKFLVKFLLVAVVLFGLPGRSGALCIAAFGSVRRSMVSQGLRI